MLSEPLTLECQATVVRGITSRLDFTWVRMDDDSEVVLRTVVGANSTGDSLVYIDSYTTPFLNESDIGVMYFCMISLNDGGLTILMDSTNFTLDIFSEDIYKICINYARVNVCIFVHVGRPASYYPRTFFTSRVFLLSYFL